MSYDQWLMTTTNDQSVCMTYATRDPPLLLPVKMWVIDIDDIARLAIVRCSNFRCLRFNISGACSTAVYIQDAGCIQTSYRQDHLLTRGFTASCAALREQCLPACD